jgi:hypothetical protein
VPETDDDDHVCKPGWCRELTSTLQDDDAIWWHETPVMSYVSFGGQHGWEKYPTTEPLLSTYLRVLGIDAT